MCPGHQPRATVTEQQAEDIARPRTDRKSGGASLVVQGRDSRWSGRRWFSTYCLMIDNVAPPHDPAKYDGDHRCSRWVRTRYCCRSLRDETPFNECRCRWTMAL